MAKIFFPDNLRQFTNGLSEVTMVARNYRSLIEQLAAQYPGISVIIDRDMMVAIDGEIITDPLLELLETDTEVHFLYRIGGG